MSSISIKAGDLMPLHVQLACYETGKFPQAILKNDSGVVLGSSPVDLVDVGDGLYTNKTIAMPGHNVIATYQVFDDAAHTIVTEEQQGGVDIFILDTFEPPVRRDEIKAFVSQSEVTSDLRVNRLRNSLRQDAVGSNLAASVLSAQTSDDEIQSKVEK